MEILETIGLIILGIIIIIGIIRVMFKPFDGFINLLIECMLLDWLFNSLEIVVKTIGDILDND